MALSVIGAGFGRTGTASLQRALDMLGLGPCHHMAEVNKSEAQKQLFRAAGRGEPTDWDLAYAGYRSAVDWPTAYFWRELASHWPDAKILLSVRDADAWYRSFSSTIGSTLMRSVSNPESFGIAVIHDKIFAGRTDDADYCKSVYHAHIAEVQAAIPPERLLTYDVKEGWEPLCTFFGLPQPPEPFPKSNSTEDFLAMFKPR